MGSYILVLDLAPDSGGSDHIVIPFSSANPNQSNDSPLRNAERKARLKIIERNSQGRVRLVRKYIQRVT